MIQRLTVVALPLIFALCMSEAAKAYMARYLGDPTVEDRCTLNPSAHIDLIGTVLLPLSLLLFNVPVLLGWGRPVLFDPRYFRNIRRDMMWMSVAPLLANLLMLIAWMFLFVAFFSKLALLGNNLDTYSEFQRFVMLMSLAGIQINTVLFLFNLIPLPPFPGGYILESILPARMALALARIQPYTIWIVLFLIYIGLFDFIFFPVMSWMQGLAFALVGMN